MNTCIKIGAVAIAAAALFFSGYRFAAALYEADIADMKAQHALATKELTDEYRKKEQNQAKRLADAWDQLEKARDESVNLRADVNRVRKLADRYRAWLSGAGADSCKPCKAELGKCVRLLSEGASLAGEGADLSVKVAADKDALAKIK